MSGGHQLPMVNVNVNAGRSNVLNRVTNQQDKWKRQVRKIDENFHTNNYRLRFFIAQRFLGARTAVANLQPTLNAQLSRRACAAYKSCS